MKNIVTIAFFVLVSFCSYATQHDNSDSNPKVDASAIIAEPSQFDEKILDVYGYVHHDTAGYSYLIGSEHADQQMSSGSFLDLVAYDKTLQKEMQSRAEGCIEIIGKFIKYSKDVLPTGALISPIGMIQIETIKSCGNQGVRLNRP